MEVNRNQIRWSEVLSLLALDLAIVISWIAYNKYQPELLGQFRFTEYALELAVVQGAILFITPPLAGWFADRLRHKGGTRLPVITIGINFVSMVFMVVALTVFADPGGTLRLLFPLLIVLWLISMNIFHSPAISMVETFVPANKLPQVVALFAVIMEACQALEPSIIDLIDEIGGPLTFAIGGTLVFASGFWFNRTTRKGQLAREAEEDQHRHDHDHKHGHDHSHDHGHNHDHGHDHSHDHDHDHEHSHFQPRTRSSFVLIFFLGAVLGVATTFFFDVFPDWAEEGLRFVGPNADIKGGYFISLLIAFAAVISYPMGILTQKLGVEKMALMGTALAAFAGFGVSFATGAISMTFFVLFPVAFAIMTVSYLPIAFQNITTRQTVLGIGLFFSGVELAPSVVDVLQAMP